MGKAVSTGKHESGFAVGGLGGRAENMVKAIETGETYKLSQVREKGLIPS